MFTFETAERERERGAAATSLAGASSKGRTLMASSGAESVVLRWIRVSEMLHGPHVLFLHRPTPARHIERTPATGLILCNERRPKWHHDYEDSPNLRTLRAGVAQTGRRLVALPLTATRLPFYTQGDTSARRTRRNH